MAGVLSSDGEDLWTGGEAVCYLLTYVEQSGILVSCGSLSLLLIKFWSCSDIAIEHIYHRKKWVNFVILFVKE